MSDINLSEKLAELRDSTIEARTVFDDRSSAANILLAEMNAITADVSKLRSEYFDAKKVVLHTAIEELGDVDGFVRGSSVDSYVDTILCVEGMSGPNSTIKAHYLGSLALSKTDVKPVIVNINDQDPTLHLVRRYKDDPTKQEDETQFCVGQSTNGSLDIIFRDQEPGDVFMHESSTGNWKVKQLPVDNVTKYSFSGKDVLVTEEPEDIEEHIKPCSLPGRYANYDNGFIAIGAPAVVAALEKIGSNLGEPGRQKDLLKIVLSRMLDSRMNIRPHAHENLEDMYFKSLDKYYSGPLPQNKDTISSLPIELHHAIAHRLAVRPTQQAELIADVMIKRMAYNNCLAYHDLYPLGINLEDGALRDTSTAIIKATTDNQILFTYNSMGQVRDHLIADKRIHVALARNFLGLRQVNSRMNYFTPESKKLKKYIKENQSKVNA